MPQAGSHCLYMQGPGFNSQDCKEKNIMKELLEVEPEVKANLQCSAQK